MTMDVNTITTLISNLGFPIVVCAYLFYSNVKEREAHEAETDALRSAIENNTQIITEIKSTIDTFIKLVQEG